MTQRARPDRINAYRSKGRSLAQKKGGRLGSAILVDARRRAAWHSAESDAWFRYIEDGMPLPWQTATTSPFDSCEPFPWDNNDPLPWDDGSDLPF